MWAEFKSWALAGGILLAAWCAVWGVFLILVGYGLE